MSKAAFLKELMGAIAARAAPDTAPAVTRSDPVGTIRAYHGTTGARGDGTGFEGLSPDMRWDQLGLHVGTTPQANSFAGWKPDMDDADVALNPDYYGKMVERNARVVPLDISLKNPIRLEDRSGSWKPYEIYDQLMEQGKITDDPDMRHEIWKAAISGNVDTRKESMRRIREIIEGLGHDGVVYKNRVEGIPSPLRNSRIDRAEAELGRSSEEMKDDEFLRYLPEAQDSYIVWSKDSYRSPFGEGEGAGWSEGGYVSPLQAAYRNR